MDPLPLLRRLVAANSINPSLVPGAPGERDAAEAAADGMRAAGLDVTLQDAAPGRPNVIGVLDGREPGPAVMFCGHIDTVGVEGMTDPFDPREADGRLYGRGSQDMKGGVAAMIAAAGVLARGWTRGRLIVAAVVDEEHMSLGAEARSSPSPPICAWQSATRASRGSRSRRKGARRTAAVRKRDVTLSPAWVACSSPWRRATAS
jgi:acetylornithine deacetylase/succinyl-diaminopimelate desuccinylase-like protein